MLLWKDAEEALLNAWHARCSRDTAAKRGLRLSCPLLPCCTGALLALARESLAVGVAGPWYLAGLWRDSCQPQVPCMQVCPGPLLGGEQQAARELQGALPTFSVDVWSFCKCFVLCMLQVWDFNRSAEMRDTEGGASKRSVLEQVQKLRTYLAQ
jgi:hypothetical protein